MAGRVVHLGTEIRAVFGVLDDDGNVIPQEPIALRLGLFKPEAFTEAHNLIVAERDKAAAHMAELAGEE